MNTNDEILDLLLKRDLLLQRVSNGLSKEIASQYIKMIDEAINSLGKVDVSLINMNKIIKEINSNIGLDYASVEDNFNEVAITEASFIPKAINGIVAVDIMNKTLPDSLVNKIVKNSILSDGYTIKEGFEKLDIRLQETFQNQIRLGVLNGDTTQTIIKNLKPYMTDFKDNRIDALVKTAVSTVINNTRLETYKENEEIFKGYQWHATLDSRTRKEHFLLDGALWDINGKGLNEKGKKYKFRNAPDGYRCRCVLLPITKSYKELGLDIEEIPVGTRSSLNGYVPADLNATDWFERQDKAFQEQYLGKGRYQLYKDGKITISDLVNQKGQTLSIKELKGISNVPVKATVPKIDFGYGGKFNKYVENIRDEAKIVIDKLPKPNYISESKNGESFYSYGSISTSNNKDHFIHEYGHHIDSKLNKNNNSKYFSENTNLFSTIRDELSKSLNIKSEKSVFDFMDSYDSILRKSDNYVNKRDLFEDILDASFNGAIFDKGYGTGHGSVYYKSNEYRKHTETFANLFALYSDKKSWDAVSYAMPKTAKEFENIMKEVIDGKFN